MSHPVHESRVCCGPVGPFGELSRRRFLGGLAGGALAGAVQAKVSSVPAASAGETVAGQPLPVGAPLRVQPVLMVQLNQPVEKASWRSYGGIETLAAVDREVQRIEAELKQLAAEAEFPANVLPLLKLSDPEQAQRVAGTDADVIVLFAASGRTEWVDTLVQAKTPLLMFLRHRSGPFYLWYEIVHWRFLRQNGDRMCVPNVDVGDIVVDDLSALLWRLRALYGLKNAKGTTMLAIGGLTAYSELAQENGPRCAQETWGYRLESISEEEFARRLAKARTDADLVQRAERSTEELLSQPAVTLQTDRKFVVNSFVALEVCKQLLRETGATNFGFARCMGRPVIEMLDTPPCLILSLANDEGYTAYCHTDLSHTLPGVLLRWIAGRPTFVCNSHFPHDGIMTVAHCAAPRKMNGKNYEPATIMTHFESDYGAACKVQYTKGQTVTVVIPNLRCTKWQAFRGSILESPSYPACRSQIEISIDGNWQKLLAEMEGFHTQVVYGDYLREVGYALKKLGGIEWQSFSETARPTA